MYICKHEILIGSRKVKGRQIGSIKMLLYENNNKFGTSATQVLTTLHHWIF